MSGAIQCAECGSAEDFRWDPAGNEEGWTCACGQKPGEPEGYCPQLDREQIDVKISDLLSHLSGELGGPEFISLSNGSEADCLKTSTVDWCRRDGRLDQRWILSGLICSDSKSHSDFWKKIGDGVVAGKDPRDRCQCGALATRWSGILPPSCGSCKTPGEFLDVAS